MNVKVSIAINDLSIYTDSEPFGSTTIKCFTDFTDAIEKYIICNNIGKLTV